MTMRSNMALATLLVLSLLGQEAPSKYELPPEQRTGGIKRIYVVCHSHLDIGFTRPPDEVARDYKDNIDAAIRLTRENKDFRWTIESAWMLEEWLRRTDDEALIAELGQMLRDGRMGFGVAFANMHSGLMGAEESNRLVYLGEKFRRKFGLKTAVAFQNDVPGFTWAYPRILAGSGVKRLVTGLNLFIGGGNSLGVSQNPFYWVGPDGSRVLTYFTYDSYMEGYRWKLSGRFPMEELEKTAPRRLAWLEKNGYKYDTYLLMASAGDNIHPEGSFRTLQRIREWNAKHSELPMKMVTAEEFFD
jgi:alpha-mannosidase